MALLRFAFPCTVSPLVPGHAGEPRRAPCTIVAVAMAEAADRSAVVRLADACRPTGRGGHFAAAGLVAELTGRPGRAVHAWLAWPAGSAGFTAADRGGIDDAPLGLIALVAARAGRPSMVSCPRFSIAWLLVHPHARRRGIATALVTHAIAHATARGAATVYAETNSRWPSAVGFWRSVGFRQNETCSG